MFCEFLHLLVPAAVEVVPIFNMLLLGNHCCRATACVLFSVLSVSHLPPIGKCIRHVKSERRGLLPGLMTKHRSVQAVSRSTKGQSPVVTLPSSAPVPQSLHVQDLAAIIWPENTWCQHTALQFKVSVL